MGQFQKTSPTSVSALILLHFLVYTNVFSQKEAPDSLEIQGHYEFAETLYQHKYSPDSSEIKAAEDRIIDDLSKEQFEETASRRSQLIVIDALIKGYDSWVYPELISESMGKHPDPTGINHYFFGSLHFKRGSYEEAASSFQEAIKRLRFESEFYLHAYFNLAAAHSENGRNAEAIGIFDSICSPGTQLNNHPELFPETIECVRINLAAMHIDEINLDAAHRELARVDTSLLTDYWKMVLRMNEMILSDGKLNFHRRDSILDHQIAKWPFAELPVNAHKYVLKAILERQDLPYFLTFRSDLLSLGKSPLLENESGFKTLLVTPPNATEFQDIWNTYCSTSKELRNQRVLAEKDIKSRNAIALQRINDALNTSQIQQDNYQRLLRILLIAIPLFILLLFAYKKYKAFENNKVLEASLRPPTHPSPDAFELTREDLRIIGDAITVGKRISDAMLILKKLSASVANKEEKLVKRDLSVVPEFNQLNAREQKIAQMIDAGFESKEIARIQNVTPEYVYNVRSRLRKKLQIPNDVELVDWFRQWP